MNIIKSSQRDTYIGRYKAVLSLSKEVGIEKYLLLGCAFIHLCAHVNYITERLCY